MLNFGVIFKNQHSQKDHGLIMQSIDRSLLPMVKRQQVDIPSLEGKYDLQEEPLYDNRIITVKFSAVVNGGPVEMQAKKRRIAKWLSGRSRLIFDDEPGLWNDAKVFDAIAFEQTFKTLVVEAFFECFPLAYGKTVTEPLVTGENPFKYLGNMKTPTRIMFQNTSGHVIERIRLNAIYRATGKGTN